MLILTVLEPSELLREGLHLAGFDGRRQQSVCRATNLMRFRSFYGSNPLVYVAILEDLQMTDLPDAHVDPAKLCLPSFLLALNFLREYRMEHQRAGLFKVCERTARKWGWFYARRIQALKEIKVCCGAASSPSYSFGDILLIFCFAPHL